MKSTVKKKDRPKADPIIDDIRHNAQKISQIETNTAVLTQLSSDVSSNNKILKQILSKLKEKDK